MLTVAPIELLDSVMSGVFMTCSAPTKSAPTVLKSDRAPAGCRRVEIRRPSYSVSLKSPPKPRTVMPVGSPRVPERWIDTPGTRCSDAATFESGNLPMSSDVITSTTPMASRFMSRLRCSEPLMPVTMTSFSSSPIGVVRALLSRRRCGDRQRHKAACACKRALRRVVLHVLPPSDERNSIRYRYCRKKCYRYHIIVGY